ncbi:hypothetical protein COL154_014087, partial [Colletotrichum chrysophilum]
DIDIADTCPATLPDVTDFRLFDKPVLAPCAAKRAEHGGAERDRTADPLLAKQVLSQLSYSPIRLATSRKRDGGPG